MGFTEWSKDFLNLSGAKDKLKQLEETVKVQEKLLEDRDLASIQTKPSSPAREQKQLDDIQGTISKRIPVRSLVHLYLNNQFVFRGVNIRADELITRGFHLVDGDEEGRKLCNELIDNSGGDNLFWQMSVNCDVGGDSYLEKVKNKLGNKYLYLRHIHPVSFGYLTDLETNNIILDANGFPKAYMQKIYDEDGNELRKEISKDRIAHLRFNTFADEFNGISSIQPVYNTTVRLMNMEAAAAEAAVKTANPMWVGKTASKSPRDVNLWSSILGKISSKDQVFLPKDMELEMKSPGTQNFNDYAEYFLDAVVAALGVPKSILTGVAGSGSGNRSTVNVQSKHFYGIIRANQRYIERLMNQIFAEYGEMAGFDPPRLVFEDIAEDADRNGLRAVELYSAGLITLEEAREMVGLDTDKTTKDELLELQEVPKINTKIDPTKEEKKSDMEAWHVATPGSPSGSQKGNKKEQKINPEVKSVR